MDPFNVKTFRKRVVDAEDGVATIDWIVLLAALTGVGVALVETTSEPLGVHARDVRGELQDNVFETSWVDSVPVGPSGEGMPGMLQTSGSTSGGTTDGGTTDGGTTDGGTTDGGTTDGGTTDGGTTDGGTTDGGTTDGGTTDDGTTDDGTTEDGTTDDGTTTDPDPNEGSGPTGPVVATSNVQGCPDSTAWIAEPVSKTGAQIDNERITVSNMTIGDGDTNLVNCPGINGVGFFYANPTYTLDLSGVTDDFWRFEVETKGGCDTTLLIQDATGAYHFNDDSGPGLNAQKQLFDMSTLNGRINIWVGTWDGKTCENAELRIDIWD